MKKVVWLAGIVVLLASGVFSARAEDAKPEAKQAVAKEAPKGDTGQQEAKQEPAKEAPKSGPDIKFEQMEHSFGKVDQGTVLEHDFEFANVGTETLKILKAQAGCGCTTTQSATEVVAGGTGIIHVRYNTAHKSGKTRQTITVTSNDSAKPEVRLGIEAEVFVAFSISPPQAVMGLVAEGATASKILSIRGGGGVKLDITEVTSGVDWLTAKLIDKESPPDAQDVQLKDLEISMTKPMPIGRQEGNVTIKTSHKGFETVNVGVQLNVVGKLRIEPAELDLGAVEAGKAATYELVVPDRDPSIYLGAPKIDLTGGTAERIVRYDGNQAKIIVTVTPNKDAKEITGELSIRTNHPVNPDLKVPIKGTVK